MQKPHRNRLIESASKSILQSASWKYSIGEIAYTLGKTRWSYFFLEITKNDKWWFWYKYRWAKIDILSWHPLLYFYMLALELTVGSIIAWDLMTWMSCSSFWSYLFPTYTKAISIKWVQNKSWKYHCRDYLKFSRLQKAQDLHMRHLPLNLTLYIGRYSAHIKHAFTRRKKPFI